MFKPSIILIIIMIIAIFTGIIINLIDPILVPQIPLIKIATFINLDTYSTDLSLVATIYSSTNINITIFIVFYLLLTLIVVVKITDTFFGPLQLSLN